MELHKHPYHFKKNIHYISNLLNIQSSYVERDYWQTFTLYLIQQDSLSEDIIVKGGIALSKCFKLIKRTPEDIDFVVARKKGETDSRLKSKLKRIGSMLCKELPEIQIEGLTREMGMNRKTAHSYWKPNDENFCPEVKHVYDIYQLLQYEKFQHFIQSGDFFKMLLSVANRDAKSFRNKNHWLKYHPADSLFFHKLNENWNIHFSQVYNTKFSLFESSQLPPDYLILETLNLIKNRLNSLPWDIAFL